MLCFACNESASITKLRRIVSCDFCDQHWHLDCLDPPMTGMPPPTRKWMCPVHSDHAMVSSLLPFASRAAHYIAHDSRTYDIRSLSRRSTSKDASNQTTEISSSFLDESTKKSPTNLTSLRSIGFVTKYRKIPSFSISGEERKMDSSMLFRSFPSRGHELMMRRPRTIAPPIRKSLFDQLEAAPRQREGSPFSNAGGSPLTSLGDLSDSGSPRFSAVKPVSPLSLDSRFRILILLGRRSLDDSIRVRWTISPSSLMDITPRWSSNGND